MAEPRIQPVRIRFPDGRSTILTYCTNVHPIEDLEAVLDALGRYCGPVRRRLGAERLSLGLWLSRRASAVLVASEHDRLRLRRTLEREALELVTLNGFPYGDFHAERVKEDVYRPDWADERRAAYTLDLARILSECLPVDVEEGTISTLPVTFTAWADAERVRAGAEALARTAAELDRLFERTGRAVRLCLEPEPDCVVETTEQAIDFFWGPLLDAARRLGVGDRALGQHLGLCFDACHQAVQFEEPARSWRALQGRGIQIGKVQLSCALEVPRAESARAGALLAPFDEIRFLHQVRRRAEEGTIEGRTDLGAALGGDRPLAQGGDWRVHFHAPLHWRPDGAGLRTTSDDLSKLFPLLAEGETLPHLEVETYTWSVLPEGLRPRDDASLIEGIAREIEFAEAALAGIGAVRGE